MGPPTRDPSNRDAYGLATSPETKNSATLVALAAARSHSVRWRLRISCSDTSVTKARLCEPTVFEEIGSRIEASAENRAEAETAAAEGRYRPRGAGRRETRALGLLQPNWRIPKRKKPAVAAAIPK